MRLREVEQQDCNENREDFRKFVNEKLYSTTSQVNAVSSFLDAMSDPKVSNMIADSLLNKTLKLKLDTLATWGKMIFYSTW